MCGIAGFWSSTRAILSDSDPKTVLESMAESLAHRGPDAQGTWWAQDAGVGLAHRRLAIQDLSPAGAQPMHSASGRYVLVFNGEIYNFRALSQTLAAAGSRFNGHSDTEVLLAAFERWGIEKALPELAGMFAIAVLDRYEQCLWLVRDRMGEKPLYYGWSNGTLLFGSELKTLERHPAFQAAVNRDALPLLLRHNFIPSPYTIYEHFYKLPPASFLRLPLRQSTLDEHIEPQRYWHAERYFSDDSTLDMDSAVASVEGTLGNVLEEQMVADVPLGAFLSGGIDSSAVVALMQQRATTPVRTFSVGFDDPQFNEAQHAADVAAYLGTAHTELHVTASDAKALIPRLPEMYDEPFADSSQIPTHLISQLTRQHVTVALSGDGGDELFGGYPRYPAALTGWDRRTTIIGRLQRLALSVPNAVTAPALKLLHPKLRQIATADIAEKLEQRAALLGAETLPDYYRQYIAYWANSASLAKGGHEVPYALNSRLPSAISRSDPLKQLMWLDVQCYLVDDILTKVDRAAMASSLETRIPLLDHRVVEAALRIPSRFNMDNGVGKQVLRHLLYRHVPRRLVDRPKQGFAVPLGSWLRNDLREWAEALLEPTRLRDEGYWDVTRIRHVWARHLEGDIDYSFQLWGILMFQAWLERAASR